MRQIVLDTETTGLEPAQGHRIIEIGCVELRNRRRTAKQFHQYLQPDREIDVGAMEVHGITNEFLVDKPCFANVAAEFIEFVKGAELVIHNAAFDVGFLNHELALLGPSWGVISDYCSVLDSLALARQLHPGQRNSLDALCKRYSIDNSQRQWHGALLDAEILTDVYLSMTGGQVTLDLLNEPSVAATANPLRVVSTAVTSVAKIIRASEDELMAHQQRLAAIEKESGGNCLWKKLDAAVVS